MGRKNKYEEKKGREENEGERGRCLGLGRRPARHRVEHTEWKKGKKLQVKTETGRETVIRASETSIR